MEFFGYSKEVACEPLERKGIEQVANKGWVTIKQNGDLTPLKVVFSSDDDPRLFAGSFVYVKGSDALKQKWSSAVYELDDKKFVLVPFSSIVMVARP